MDDHGVPEPVNGAGLTDEDPDQSWVLQAPDIAMVDDVDQLPEGEPTSLDGIVNDIEPSGEEVL
jgi:hypothetical protein